jgi:hypothetical protein
VTEPRYPSHANYTFPTSNPRLTGKRHLFGYAYAANGNVHNPTPHYLWLLILDGSKTVDTFHRQRDLKSAVAEYGNDYAGNTANSVPRDS